MRASIEDLKAFVRVVEQGSFHGAADDMALTTSALSRRLQKLEDILGAKLLDRSSRRAELTPIGREFLPMARQVIGGMDRALSRIHDVIEMRAGTVTVAAGFTIANHMMPGIVRRFTDEHPEVRVRMLDDVGPKIGGFVRRGDAEFGIMFEDGDWPDMRYTPIIDDPFVLACRPDHPLASRRRVRWRDLAGHAFACMSESSGNQRFLTRELHGRALLPEGRYEVQHLSTLVGCLRAGVGVSAMSNFVMALLHDDQLVCRPLVEPVVRRKIGVIELPGRTLSPAAEYLKSLAVAELVRLRKRDSGAGSRRRE